MTTQVATIDGHLITAARALAGLTIIELAELANVAEKTIRKIEGNRRVEIWPTLRHGYVSQATWNKIASALESQGVELLRPRGGAGAGVRWKRT